MTSVPTDSDSSGDDGGGAHGRTGAGALTGPVAYMAQNGVAANLLLVFLLAAGVFSMGSLVQEVFPEFSLDVIQVSVPYPGATPEEVEESIVRKIEEQLEGVDGVKDITSTSAEGMGVVSVSLRLGADASQVLDDIKAEVDRIPTFPIESEPPQVQELTNRQSVILIALFGDVSERTLKELAYRTEDQLSALPEVSFVQTSGVRAYEISIEVPSAQLRALGLTLGDVASAVRQGSLDLSAGSIETREAEIRVRTLGRSYDQQDFEDIIVVSRGDGTEIRLSDIATVRDGFEDTDLITRYNGSPAAFVEVYRTSDERVLEIVAAVESELESSIKPNLPVGVDLEIWQDNAEVLADRLGLLKKNALIGLVLVLIALTLFLDLQLAFWTAVGIGVSFVGTLGVMLVLGVSINVMSLFAFILAIGIVVDDAIVVGENVFVERERGLAGLDAAVKGATRIARPVTFAVLTTVVAFSPLLFVPGTIGNILGAIPIIVISVLGISLIESLFILPNHLTHLRPPHQPATGRVFRFFGALQNRVDRGLKRFVEGPLSRALRFSTEAPGVVIAAGVALIVLSVATVPAGWVRIQFFPEVEGDIVSAQLEMPEGTSAAVTTEFVGRIEAAAYRAGAALEAERDGSLPDLIEGVRLSVGSLPAEQGPRGADAGVSRLQSHLASVEVRLLGAEDREIAATAFEQMWRDELGSVDGVRSLTFASALLAIGAAVQVEITHPDPARLEAVGASLVDELSSFEGVFEVETDRDQGLQEVQLRLKPAARSMGLTLEGLARQVRGAFFGDEALRVQKGREDVRVYVRLPEGERDGIADIEQYYIQLPGGGEAPLGAVAEATIGSSPTSIQRKNGQRVLTITADVDPLVVTGQELSGQLEDEILPQLAAIDPLLSYSFGGEQQEQAESFSAMGKGFLLALLVMYALLAVPFRSYVQPLIIMSAIPFGVIGAMLAHLAMGLPLGILSLFGIIGLSGVVVNDSLVMIDFINELKGRGMEYNEAIVMGAKQRFRPIFLTSVTTFLGVAPLVFETSLQAQFLIPMAASLGFGTLFATAILMVLVPALATVEHRAEVWFRRVVMGRQAS